MVKKKSVSDSLFITMRKINKKELDKKSRNQKDDYRKNGKLLINRLSVGFITILHR